VGGRSIRPGRTITVLMEPLGGRACITDSVSRNGSPLSRGSPRSPADPEASVPTLAERHRHCEHKAVAQRFLGSRRPMDTLPGTGARSKDWARTEASLVFAESELPTTSLQRHIVARGAECQRGKGAFGTAKQGSRLNGPSPRWFLFLWRCLPSAVASMIMTYDKPAERTLMVF
jgi:hypothetical protein